MIDAHLHLGKDLVYDGMDTTKDIILEIMKQCHLEKCVVYPGNSNISKETEREKNKEVEGFFQQYPNQILGICSLNPNYEEEEYEEEVRAYKKNGFLGINVNPQIYGWDPLSHHGMVVFQTAMRTQMPLFINVGIGLPLGQPVRLIERCKEYSNVPVVLVHAGKSYCGNQCNVVAQECPNVYLETSMGPNMRTLKKYVKTYGANRIIMGSGLMSLVEHSIYCFKHCGISDDELDWATKKTILNVLGLEGGDRS